MDADFDAPCKELRGGAEKALHSGAQLEPETSLENAPNYLDDGPPEADAYSEEARGNGKIKPSTEPVAKKLVAIGEQAQLFHDDRRDGYAVVKHEDVHMTVRLRGRDFRRWLARQYWIRHGGAASGDALQTALNVLEAKAVFEGRCLPLSNRFAYRDGTIYIDLADAKWRVVKRLWTDGRCSISGPLSSGATRINGPCRCRSAVAASTSWART